jgi:hypothetical protein
MIAEGLNPAALTTPDAPIDELPPSAAVAAVVSPRLAPRRSLATSPPPTPVTALELPPGAGILSPRNSGLRTSAHAGAAAAAAAAAAGKPSDASPVVARSAGAPVCVQRGVRRCLTARAVALVGER